ncbi:type II toxin-antitoxin system RelE/ParE family toxin [Haliscomenobacter hydrossis]|uniref:Plasmid stabilization system n=1 Tax=Haliscomenobacter hydrossis (strain ATCC 27775 / DSM 1100 / LMG 10767 / O) TaxID=760192 RepID=F4L6W4_HALH1|nr:type II toxin-antitoxin system RelE/ParE family toxin [Haliscomenobacter hydrossis]AEE51919.1 plasmid stabilization system [Haliscomenobacter hydrossis DSM 1100]
MTVLYTAWAKNQLREIYNYYKEIGSSKKGRKIRISIHKKVLKLKAFPFLGREEELLSVLGQGHRYIVEGQYKIIYRIIEDNVYITDIFDARRNPDLMMP